MNVKLPYQRPNYDGLVVIGAGLPRTGTMSMKTALGQLLDGKCYHMTNVLAADNKKEEISFWNKATDGRVTKEEWKQFLEGRGFRAGVDYPISLFYKDLMEVFPGAKVVLTVRDPESWYHSVKNTIFQFYDYDFALSMFDKITRGNLKDIKRIDNHVPEGMDKGMMQAISEGKDSSVRHFNGWVEQVKSSVPEDKLLIFEAKEGWEPLCKFLNVPVPDGAYPRVNDTAEMKQNLRSLRIVAYSTVYGLPLVLLMVLSGLLVYFIIFF